LASDKEKIMGSLDRLPKHESNDGYLHRVCIPCVYNSGRRATVRVTIGHPEVIDIGIDTDRQRPYQSVVDGYLHIDTESIVRDLETDPHAPIVGYRHKEALEMVEMIKGVNTHYFAGDLQVLSDDKMIADSRCRRERGMRDVLRDVGDAWNDYSRTLDFAWCLSEYKKPAWWRGLTGRAGYALSKLRKQHERVERLVPLSDAHLGGTWQRFYMDNSWLDQAAAIKGGRIYLA
jgi:hypothetical protein